MFTLVTQDSMGSCGAIPTPPPHAHWPRSQPLIEEGETLCSEAIARKRF